ncbi:DNA-(apurinic or apyrimidinic site) lyase [Fasciola gigantica]|uniref:DNA-(Apurinic or apyrimidinic site) lyase n=1 Tax=Fasciola gigantica TaxID=46835 RepID=A0A504YS24_FASGI|nr:DNA-(apurinic or apyrimidinic site) lyase [Fasciola gigantica]
MTTWNHSWPALCSRYWPQCQHKQTSLTTFVARDVREPVAYGDSASSRTPVVANKESVIRVLRGGDNIDSSGGTNDTRGKRSTSNAPSATSDKSNEKLKLKQAKLLIVSSVASHTKNGDESKPKSTPSFENMEPVTSPTPRPSTTTKLTSSNSATHMIETKQTVQSAHEWRRLLTGPKKPPLCRGHSEPCVLRTVKQEYTASGARRGKRFWVCGRPQGFRGNPEARCETFIWDDRYQNITR